MARVESLGEFFHFSNTRRKKNRRNEEISSGRFSALLTRSAEEAEAQEPLFEGTLEELVDEVHAAGDALGERQSEEAIAAYRRAVQGFLRYAVGHLYVTERHRSRPSLRRGTQVEYVLIQTIDRKLEVLTGEVLRGQIRQIEILRRVEEIYGLIVDLIR